MNMKQRKLLVGLVFDLEDDAGVRLSGNNEKEEDGDASGLSR